MPLILPGNVGSATASTTYDVANSARFDDGSSDNLQRTYGTPTNAKIFALSWWIKLGKAWDGSGSQDLWGERTDSNNRVFMGINGAGQFDFFEKNSGSNVVELKTNRLFRDNSAWYHFLLLGDSTQGTASNRIKLYVNGVQETSFATATYPSGDYLFRLAVNTVKYFGRIGLGGSLSTNYFDGYLAEAVFVDGNATAHTDYGEFDSDSPTIWKPKNVSGLTFGNNGFYLDFEDSSALGNDVSGNDNDFTVNNLTAVDQSTDTCTNNFATMNPLDNYFTGSTFSEGNLKIATGGSSLVYNTSTLGFNTGKWYMEVKCSGSVRYVVGVITGGATANDNDNKLGNRSDGWGYDYRGLVENAGADEGGSFATFSSGNIIGIYADLDNNKLYFSKDGTLQNSGTGLNLDVSGSPTYFFAVGDNHASESSTFEVNFGSPSFAISSGNTDGEYGNFEYSTTITGDGASKTFKALNTKNLAEFG
jgi:hypothetical protein